MSDELESQMTKILLPQKLNPLLPSGSFVGRSLSSLKALKEQIVELRAGNNSIFESKSDNESESGDDSGYKLKKIVKEEEEEEEVNTLVRSSRIYASDSEFSGKNLRKRKNRTAEYV